MEGEFQYQNQLGQNLEDWLNPREGQYTCSLFSEEYKQDYIQL